MADKAIVNEALKFYNDRKKQGETMVASSALWVILKAKGMTKIALAEHEALLDELLEKINGE